MIHVEYHVPDPIQHARRVLWALAKLRDEGHPAPTSAQIAARVALTEPLVRDTLAVLIVARAVVEDGRGGFSLG